MVMSIDETNSKWTKIQRLHYWKPIIAFAGPPSVAQGLAA
jgi:hypothetical protein